MKVIGSMRMMLLVGVGVAFAALIPISAKAQDRQFLDETINNHGLPRTAPSLSLSSIYGLNPCSSGVSVGVSTPLFGFGGAKANIDQECEIRNNAAIAVSALHDERLAREILCTIKTIREAAARLHEPCLQDGGVMTISAAARLQNPVPGPRAPFPAVPLVETVPERYAPAQPMYMPRRVPGTWSSDEEVPTRSEREVPAFCRTPGLARTLYPECAPVPPSQRRQ